MKIAPEASWMAAGLVFGAGVAYCAYRLTRSRPRPSMLADLTADSCDKMLDTVQVQTLLLILEHSEDSEFTERTLVTLGNSAAFSSNQVIIRELGGVPVIASKINHHNHSIREKALNALNNLSLNVKNQVEIKEYISQVCAGTFSEPLNSAVQLAGLRLLTNMMVTNDYHHMLSGHITDLFRVLLTGNESTKVQVLKVLVNLSENPAMTEDLLGAQVDSAFLSLYDSHIAEDILLRALTLFHNINNSLKTEDPLSLRPKFTKGSLFYLLYVQE